MNHDDNRPEHDLHVLTVDDYNERGSYGTMLVCSCGERVSIDGDSWDYADTLVCMHLGYYDEPRLDFPDFIDKAFAQLAADQAIVAAAKAWGQAERRAIDADWASVKAGGRDVLATANAVEDAAGTLFSLVDPGEG